jgi:hypothetical protein
MPRVSFTYAARDSRSWRVPLLGLQRWSRLILDIRVLNSKHRLPRSPLPLDYCIIKITTKKKKKLLNTLDVFFFSFFFFETASVVCILFLVLGVVSKPCRLGSKPPRITDSKSSFGKPVSVFVFESCFRKQKQKTVFCCFFVKKVFGKLFSKIIFENRKQYLRCLDNYFQNSFHLKRI